jgi:hypothetical protein
MYLQKVISRKTFLNLFFVGILNVHDVTGSGSGSTPKCHGSGTLELKSLHGIVLSFLFSDLTTSSKVTPSV